MSVSWWPTLWQLTVQAWRLAQARPRVVSMWLLAVAAASYAASFGDAAAHAWVVSHQVPAWRAAAEAASYWGKLHLAPAFAVGLIGLAGWLWRRRELYMAAISGALAAATAGLAVQILKALFGRPRPHTGLPDGFYWFEFQARMHSFPSGHALHCFAIVGAVALLAPRTATGLAVLALGVSLSRFYVLAHHPSDLVGGALLGLGVGYFFGLAGRKWLAARAPH